MPPPLPPRATPPPPPQNYDADTSIPYVSDQSAANYPLPEEPVHLGDKIFPGTEGLTVAEIADDVSKGGRFACCLYAISIGVLSFRRASGIRYIRAGKWNWHACGYSLVALILGPWGIPWGPIFTLQALSTNLSGGKDFTVQILSQYTGSLRAEQLLAERTRKLKWRKLLSQLILCAVIVGFGVWIFWLVKEEHEQRSANPPPVTQPQRTKPRSQPSQLR